MASRDLRYNWFKNVMRDNSIDYLVTAHHSDDNYETIIFNLLKTTGYKGLIGIPHFNNKIIRPFNVFGPGQKDGKCGAVIPIWTTSLLEGNDITIYGEGTQSREFINNIHTMGH